MSCILIESCRYVGLSWAQFIGMSDRALHGLMRVRGFTQDDAHVFCLPDQIAAEILRVLHLTEKILSDFGFNDYEINLSTRPEKSVGVIGVKEMETQTLSIRTRKGGDLGVISLENLQQKMHQVIEAKSSL